MTFESAFLHEGRPIFFEAHLPFEEREFYANIFATNEEHAALFAPEELLDACYCSGCLGPEHKRNTKATDELMKKCDVAGEYNNLF